jgi:hypothetical protein
MIALDLNVATKYVEDVLFGVYYNKTAIDNVEDLDRERLGIKEFYTVTDGPWSSTVACSFMVVRNYIGDCIRVWIFDTGKVTMRGYLEPSSKKATYLHLSDPDFSTKFLNLISKWE